MPIAKKSAKGMVAATIVALRKSPKKNPLNEKDENDAEYEIMKHGFGRYFDEIAAVVDSLDAHAGGEQTDRADVFDFRLDSLYRRQALLPATHQNNALNDIVVIVLAGNAKARLVADTNVRNVAHAHGIAVCRSQHGVADVIDRTNKTYAANDRRLLANVDGIAANVDVAVVENLKNLRQRQSVCDQFVEINLNLEGLALATPAGDIDDTGHCAESTRENPLLQSLQVHHAIVRWTHKSVAEDFPDRTGRRDRRLRLIGKLRQLAEPVQHLLLSLFISQIICKLQLHIGQAE